MRSGGSSMSCLLQLSMMGLLTAVAMVSALPQWRAGGQYGLCSHTCAGGKQYRTVRCATEAGETLPDAQCATVGPRPKAYIPCNRHDCPPETSYEAWGDCQLCYRNRTQRCLVTTDGLWKRQVPLRECGLSSSVEQGVCLPYDCPVLWAPKSYPCCHELAKKGIVCLFKGKVPVESWLCYKFTHIYNLKLPTPAQCHQSETCAPPTTQPTTAPITKPPPPPRPTQPETEDFDPSDPFEAAPTTQPPPPPPTTAATMPNKTGDSVLVQFGQAGSVRSAAAMPIAASTVLLVAMATATAAALFAGCP